MCFKTHHGVSYFEVSSFFIILEICVETEAVVWETHYRQPLTLPWFPMYYLFVLGASCKYSQETTLHRLGSTLKMDWTAYLLSKMDSIQNVGG